MMSYTSYYELKKVTRGLREPETQTLYTAGLIVNAKVMNSGCHSHKESQNHKLLHPQRGTCKDRSSHGEEEHDCGQLCGLVIHP